MKQKARKRSDHFPKDFFWGASTASHQVEGGTHNQWSVWELGHAAERAAGAQRRLDWTPAWHNKQLQPAMTQPQNYVSGDGVKHLTRYKEDFSIARSLNFNAFRFGIEWSRIEPQEGQWNQVALDHYKKYIAELRAQGLEPFLNIWHWTNPLWFEEKGAFAKRKNLVYFKRFVKKIAEELLDDVTYVLTINEANSYVTLSYLNGDWPPQQKNIVTTLRVYYNLAEAHKIAYKVLKKHKSTLQIGVAHQANANFAINKNNPLQRLTARLSDYVWDEWFYNRIRRSQDFIGMNHYFTNYWKGVVFDNPKDTVSDLGWYMEPARIYDVIMRLSKKYKKPIIITENGLADATDQHRQWWLEETITAMDKALADGADLRGYLHWSLVDNFEWAEGWWPKFGLVAVDREHGMKRTVRPSAHWFAERIKQLS
ncbi:MAG: glycoside hydrolase family 1 protein [Candidatus Saccharimonadales bacterium]